MGIGAITSRGSFGIVENNLISNGVGGIFDDGHYNVIQNNKVTNTSRGITINSEGNIIENNLVKDSNTGFDADDGLWRSFFINNYAYNNKYGFRGPGYKDNTIKCGMYVNNTGADISLYMPSGKGFRIIGAIFNKLNSHGSHTIIEHDCRDVKCRWFGDDCLEDEDWDDVLDEDDFCLGTVYGEEIIDYGCSCNQILEKKPGKSKGEMKNGCSQGTIDVFMNLEGWAKEFFK